MIRVWYRRAVAWGGVGFASNVTVCRDRGSGWDMPGRGGVNEFSRFSLISRAVRGNVIAGAGADRGIT